MWWRWFLALGPALSEEQKDLLWGYLKGHFSSGKPVAQLPQEWYHIDGVK